MRKWSRRPTVIIVALILILCTAIGWFSMGGITSAEKVSEAEAKKITEARYQGKIVGLVQKDDHYIVQLQLDTGEYEVSIDRMSGDVLGINRTKVNENPPFLTAEEARRLVHEKQDGDIQKFEKRRTEDQLFYEAIIVKDRQKTVLTLDGITGEVVSQKVETLPPPMEVPRIITEMEAVKIALGAVSGEIDDVDYEENDGLIYYLIDIEQADGQDYTVQINAISGVIMSIMKDD